MIALRISPSPDWLDDMRAVGQHEAGHAGGREVVDEVLHPGVVGVARGRHAVTASARRRRSRHQSLSLNGGLART